MLFRKILMLSITTFIFNIAYANVYCPQSFDADCLSNPINSCNFTWKDNLPQPPNLKINGHVATKKYLNMQLKQDAQFEKDSGIFGNSLICNYSNANGEEVDLMYSFLPDSINAILKNSKWVAYSEATEDCKSTNALDCPLSSP